MTAYDVTLADLAGRIRGLSARAQVGLFWACARALVPEAGALGDRAGPALQRGLVAAYELAMSGTRPRDPAQLLAAGPDPALGGEAAGASSPPSAESCWRCAGVCLRLLADDGYDAGSAIAYALEPMVNAVTRDLAGASPGDGATHGRAPIEAVLADNRVAEAIAFCRWATGFLRDRPSPTGSDLSKVRMNAVVIRPEPPPG